MLSKGSILPFDSFQEILLAKFGGCQAMRRRRLAFPVGRIEKQCADLSHRA